MKPFSLLIKPASADCNLRCHYCFYIDHLENVEKTPRMSDEVLDAMISSYMQTNQNLRYSFGWQGGEPTLMRVDFFKKVVELQQKYAPPNAIINNGLQTNGTLITEAMAKLFGEYKFLLGVSLDGPAELHDHYRKTIGHKPTHHRVMQGIERLKKNNVEFNILILVNNVTVRHAKQIYHYLCDNGFYYHQYIPCVEFDEDGNLLPFSITGDDWGKFLSELFDEWIKKDIYKVSIRSFDSLVEYLVYNRYNVCYMGKNCCQYFVVEYDGSVYPCDFFVREDLILGNVKNNTWDELSTSPMYKKFGAEKERWNSYCNKCSYLNLCHGDCQKFRYGWKTYPKSLSILCKGWRIFYTHSLSRFKYIVENYKSGKNIYSDPTNDSIRPHKVGRNESCPCGSGKKYKNCCII